MAETMTVKEFMALPADEQNAIVVEHVLGWHLREGDECPADAAHEVTEGVWQRKAWVKPNGDFKCVLCGDGPDDYISDISASWQVVERLTDTEGPYRHQKWSFGLEHSAVVDWVADFTPRANHERARQYPAFQAQAVTAPLAICIAALKAIGYLREEG